MRNVSKVSRRSYLRVSIYNLTFAEAPEVRTRYSESDKREWSGPRAFLFALQQIQSWSCGALRRWDHFDGMQRRELLLPCLNVRRESGHRESSVGGEETLHGVSCGG